MSRKVRNMEEFARLSGISRPTVSKYFNDPASVRGTTREKIERALQAHDYRPNVYAMNQNRRLTKTVGIVVPYLADPFFAEMARLLERRCIEAGLSPVLYSAHGDAALEAQALDALRSLRPAGVLLAPLGRASDRRAIDAFCRDVPTVLFDSHLDAVGAAFVGSDVPQSVALMVDYLCRTGAPPCLFEMAAPANPNARRRRTAYVEAMRRLGHDPATVEVAGEGWGFEAVGYEGGMRLFAEGAPEGRSILCSNDRLAIGVLTAAFESGVRVGIGEGSEVRVAGLDDHPFARFTCPALTTIAQDYDGITRRSAELLFALVEGGRREGAREEVLFDGRLVMRASA